MIQQFLHSKIRSALPFTPNSGQEILIRQLAEFLFTRAERPCFVLRGYAGTGKSSIVGALVKALQALEQPIVLMAPTGRAAKVLARYAGHSAYTIHKQIYRRAQATGEQFNIGFNNLSNTLFVVDEASMLSAERDNSVFGSGSLLDDLIRYVFMQNGNRLLLLGDDAQLPPVGHDESPALNPDYLSGYGLDVHTGTLTEVARQAGDSGILLNATQLRQAKTIIPLTETDDLRLLPPIEMVEQIEQSYHTVGLEETLIITRSNRRTNLYNQGVRAQLLDYDELLNTGDRIMVSRNNSFQTASYKDDKGELLIPFLANGDMFQVVRLRKHHEMYGFQFAEADLQGLDYPYEISVLVWLDTLVTPTPEDSYKLQRELYQRIAEDYPEIHSKRELNEHIQASPYYNALQIRYAYAVTCHKAQGGQWRHVFIDQGPLASPSTENPEPRTEIPAPDYRWLYTALTRATERVWVLRA